MTELISFVQGYKPATSNYMRRYFDGLKGTWDGQPRIQYLLPHFMKAPAPFSAAWRFSLWMVDYVATIYNGASCKDHYVIDFVGEDANTMVLMMKQLNPIGRGNIGGVNYNSRYFADMAVSDGILTDTYIRESEDYAEDDKLNIDDEMLNMLDNLPIAIVRATRQPHKNYRYKNLIHLYINSNNDYGRGQKRKLQKNMKRIDESVRDQIWAEAVYMYFDQKDDHYAIVNGYAIDANMDPSILYN